MILYAESSGVLAWLLGEPLQAVALRELRAADRVMASSLTGIECARGLARARANGRISATDELAALRLYDVAESSWDIYDLGEDVARRARNPFPMEPVRTLDALHLSTALILRDALGSIRMLSFDDRVRENARVLNIELVPM